MVAHIYTRVSTDAQAEKGYSLQTQLDACRAKARELGALELVEHIDDGFSGSDLDRPGLNALRDALSVGDIDFVVCYDPDRLARELSHQLLIADEIDKSGAKLVFVSVAFEKSPEGKLFFSIRGAVSEFERKKIQERTVRGKVGKARTGKVVFNAHPFGFGWDADNSMYVIDAAEAKIVRHIYDMALSGSSTAAIARALNHSNIPSPKNKKWHAETVRRILIRPLYYGKLIQFKEKATIVNRRKIVAIRDEKDWIYGKCPAIVTEEEFERTAIMLARQKKFTPRNDKEVFLGKGLLYCGVCGSKMSTTTCGRNSDKKYYRCDAVKLRREFNHKIACNNRGILTSFLDNRIWEVMEALIKDPEKIKSMLVGDAKDKSYVAAHDALIARRADLERERDAVMKWFRGKLIDEKEAERQLSDIKKQLESIAIQLSELRIYKARAENIDDKVRRFVDIVTTATNRRDACVKLLERIEYVRHDQQKGRWSNPDITLNFSLL